MGGGGCERGHSALAERFRIGRRARRVRARQARARARQPRGPALPASRARGPRARKPDTALTAYHGKQKIISHSTLYSFSCLGPILIQNLSITGEGV